jgi:hypothetical protein
MVQATSASVGWCPLEGSAVVWNDQEVPFHTSARRNWTSELSRYSVTLASDLAGIGEQREERATARRSGVA